MTKYPNLFSPLTVGPLTLKNRIAVPPMSADDAAYELRAKGGAALVTVGETMVHADTTIAHPGTMCLDDEGNMPLLIQTAEKIRRYNTLASIEIVHSGRRAHPKYTKNGIVYGPSPGMGPYGVEVTEMDEDLIEEIIEAFGHGAFMAKYAGFDLCMLHAGHGWLLAQFLSPLNNQRRDRFGGSLENRARFTLLVIERIREKCGPDFPIELRLSGDEFYEGGMQLAETVELAKLLDGKVDIIHISAATFHQHGTSGIRMFPNMFLPPGCNVYMAREIKKAVQTPVAVVGALNGPAMLEEIIASGAADIVCVGRGILADPDLPKKAKSGREEDITHCLRCNDCISGGFIPHIPIATGVNRCPVNPDCGREDEVWRHHPAGQRKKVLVVGGGPGGMQAAITAADRGHEVILCEKSDALGGTLKLGIHPAFKADLKEYLEVLMRRVRTRPIDLRLNTEVTPALAAAFDADVIIAALGAEPIIPDLPGIENSNVVLVGQLQTAGEPIGQKVVVVGGGLVGCEEGLHLAMQGKDVTILETKDGLAKDASFLHWKALMLELEKYVQTVTNTTCTRITDGGVCATAADDTEKFYPADTVLIAVGYRAKTAEAEKLRNCAPDFIAVGDCVKPRKIMEAVHGGYYAGLNL